MSEKHARDEHGHHHEHHGGNACACHDHGCGHEHGEGENRKEALIRIGLSGALLLLGLLLPLPQGVKIAVFLLSWLIVGYKVILGAGKNLLHGHPLDELFLMTVASVGAFCLGDFAEGVAVMLLYQIGEFFQDYAVDQSRDSIAELMDIRPDSAHVERAGRLETVSPQSVNVGEIILVRPGEKIPLDGTVVEGRSALNTLALTGEAMPRDVEEGDSVISGCVNQHGVLRIAVTHTYGDSTVERILELVEHAADHKSKADRFITRFARVYTPAVVGLAILVALVPPLLFGGAWRQWIVSALTFLVISCPCALVISVPLTFFSAIGGASRRGILIKGAGHVEALAQAGIVVLDKTGTLTRGEFAVARVDARKGTKEDVIALAAAAERFSSHPIAQSLREACAQDLSLWQVENVEELSGHGVRTRINGENVWVGNAQLMEKAGVACPRDDEAGTSVYVAKDGEYLGRILIADAPKEGARQAMEDLAALGVRRRVMLTGDGEAAARAVARQVGIQEYRFGLLPDGKVARVEALLKEKQGKETLLFVGDGINDAPVLARADVGVAMGALGSDAAIEAADVVLMDDDPRKLGKAIRMARATVKIVKQNIVFSLAVKALVMLLGVLHLAPLWLAIFADVGVCFLAILNAMRAMHAAQ